MQPIKLAPSILSCDFARLGEEVEAVIAAGADYIHVDVMDGRFVPNISIGLPIVKALRPIARQHNIPLNTHLMIVEPEKYIEAFAAAGADHLIIHTEATPHVHRAIQMIKDCGAKAGVAFNPATPTTVLEEILPDCDFVLVMTVNPGFGGQNYIARSTNKIRRVKHMISLLRSHAELIVDGGVNAENTAEVVRAGGQVLVAGSAVYNDEHSVAHNMDTLRSAIMSSGIFET